MKLKLQNGSQLFEIKQAFHTRFPFLKLEFFNPLADESKKFTHSNLITDDQKTLGEIAELHPTGYVNIDEHESIASVEQGFKDSFGVDVQVFRKSGDSWLETTSSDDQTLAELNAKGENANIPFRTEIPPEDIHEQE